MKEIYADYNATAPLHPDVKAYLQKRFHGPFAHPSALHARGIEIHQALEFCKNLMAEKLGCTKDNIQFNSGSSESIERLFFHIVGEKILGGERPAIVCSPVEHSAVLDQVNYWATKGAQVHWLKVDSDGSIDTKEIESCLVQHKPVLLCCMAANNETGLLYPYEEIALLCSKYSVLYCCDTTQIIGRLPFDFKKSSIDFAFLSSHKLGALGGSGALLVKNKELIPPRKGTPNYLAIETMGVVFHHIEDQYQLWAKVLEKKISFEHKCLSTLNNITIFSSTRSRLPNTTLLSLEGIHSQALQIELESRNILVTTSSACSDNEPETSTILKAMGTKDSMGRGAVRISTTTSVTTEDYEGIFQGLKSASEKLLKLRYY
jgi:cysteine desulfurase